MQETEDTQVLISKLKSTDPADTLIVTSIQNMSNINDDYANLKEADIKIINAKRIVITRPVIFKIERIDIPENEEEAAWLAKQNFKNTAEDAYTG